MNLNGFFIVNKPLGPTSHDIVRLFRKQLQTRSIGHIGTLDPEASGVLVLALGEATKAIPYLDDSIKEYISTFLFGITTNTYDHTGTNQETFDATTFTQEQLYEILPSFLGKISQQPPMYSAVKVDGKKLYEYARNEPQTEVKIPTKTVEIFEIEVLSFNSPSTSLRIECSKGTYIRSLAHDMGQTIGIGAHTTKIHRTRSGNFTIDQAISPSEILDTPSMYLRPIEQILPFPHIHLTPEEKEHIFQGRSIPHLSETLKSESFTSLLFNEKLLSVAQFKENRLFPKRIFHI